MVNVKRKLTVVFPTLMLAAVLSPLPAKTSSAQNAALPSQAVPAAQAAPAAPRWPDGRVNLGPPPGGKGVWQGDGRLVVNPNSYEPNSTRAALIHIDAVPLQPWARELVDARHSVNLRYEPHARCKASGGPREFVTPYGFEMVDLPELQRIYLFDIGGPHSFRIIYMDGRSHPRDLVPSYYGHSVGHWEGDTLVVDTIGYNEKFWMSRDGLPHTDQLHLTERWTRPDLRTLKYEVTIDDPGAYTAAWTSGFNLRWSDGVELFEYICQDNNQFPNAVLEPEDQDAPTSRIAP